MKKPVNKDSPHHVSWLLNFFVTTFPSSSPNRSAIFCDKSGCELPLKILMLGILGCSGGSMVPDRLTTDHHPRSRLHTHSLPHSARSQTSRPRPPSHCALIGPQVTMAIGRLRQIFGILLIIWRILIRARFEQFIDVFNSVTKK